MHKKYLFGVNELLSFPRREDQKLTIGHVNIGIIWSCIGNSQWCITTLSRNLIGCSTLRLEYLQADWFLVQNNEKATLNINMPYYNSWHCWSPCWSLLLLRCRIHAFHTRCSIISLILYSPCPRQQFYVFVWLSQTLINFDVLLFHQTAIMIAAKVFFWFFFEW